MSNLSDWHKEMDKKYNLRQSKKGDRKTMFNIFELFKKREDDKRYDDYSNGIDNHEDINKKLEALREEIVKKEQGKQQSHALQKHAAVQAERLERIHQDITQQLEEEERRIEQLVKMDVSVFQLMGRLKESTHIMVRENRDEVSGETFINNEMYEFTFKVKKLTD